MAFTWGQSNVNTGQRAVAQPVQPATPVQVPQLAQQVAQQSAAAADPFASQRAQYQPQLAELMGGPRQDQVTSDIERMREVSRQPIGGPYMGMLEKLMTDKGSITMTPGSQFAMEQAQQALARSKAAEGYLGSGNILSELQKQAQGIASQDYTQQLADLRAAAGLSQGVQGQAFGQAGQVAGAAGKDVEDRFGRLALLSGATTGSPGAAGSLLANQWDWANQGVGGGGGGSSGGGGMESIAPSSAGYFRDNFGNLQYGGGAARAQAENAWRNWGRSSLL